jgi:hypothetical protein
MSEIRTVEDVHQFLAEYDRANPGWRPARILEVIKTGNPDKAATNLKFLVDTGLISSRQRREDIQTFLNERTAGHGPALPIGTYSGSAPTPGSTPAPGGNPFWGPEGSRIAGDLARTNDQMATVRRRLKIENLSGRLLEDNLCDVSQAIVHSVLALNA